MSGRTIVVAPDAEALAREAAERLATRVVEAQRLRGRAALVLTGGGIGTAVLAALRSTPAVETVDWSRLDLWWGDERFLPAGHPDRNETTARRALLDHVPVDAARVHPMGPAGGQDGDDPDAAAARYAEGLPEGGSPSFDVVLLGVGPEGHTASIFPESPAAHDGRRVLAVHGCPKPPPTRLTLGFSALNDSREVWLLASGPEKATAVALALSGAGRVQVPAAGVAGHQQTLWLVDEAAAGALPHDLRRR